MPKGLSLVARPDSRRLPITRKTQKKAAPRFGGAAHSGSRRRATCENVLGRNAGHKPGHATHVHIRIRRGRLRHSAVQERARIPEPSSRWRNSRLSMRSPVQGRAAHKLVRRHKLQIRFSLHSPGTRPDQEFQPLTLLPTSTSSCCPYFLRSRRLSALSRPDFAATWKLCSCCLPGLPVMSDSTAVVNEGCGAKRKYLGATFAAARVSRRLNLLAEGRLKMVCPRAALF
jgi:hypothetical protein